MKKIAPLLILVLKTTVLGKKVIENLHEVPKRKINLFHFFGGWGEEENEGGVQTSIPMPNVYD